MVLSTLLRKVRLLAELGNPGVAAPARGSRPPPVRRGQQHVHVREPAHHLRQSRVHEQFHVSENRGELTVSVQKAGNVWHVLPRTQVVQYNPSTNEWETLGSLLAQRELHEVRERSEIRHHSLSLAQLPISGHRSAHGVLRLLHGGEPVRSGRRWVIGQVRFRGFSRHPVLVGLVVKNLVYAFLKRSITESRQACIDAEFLQLWL